MYNPQIAALSEVLLPELQREPEAPTWTERIKRGREQGRGCLLK